MHGTDTPGAIPETAERNPAWTRTALPLGLAAVLLMGLVAVGWQPLLQLDQQIAAALHQQALIRPNWTATNRILSDWVWDPWTMRLLLAAAFVRLWFTGQRPLAYWTVASAAVCTALQQLLKAVIDRERPAWEPAVDSAHYAAMPSGHAMTAAFTCLVLLWLTHRAGAATHVCRAVLAIGAVSVAGVCVTRMALGVHWMTDTLAGALLGVALAVTAVACWIRRAAGAPPGGTVRE
jgi:membrane-associated phospholipid phosphatase